MGGHMRKPHFIGDSGEGRIHPWVWKLSEDKAIWLNGLMCFFSHIQAKGADLGMETGKKLESHY